MSEVVTDTIKNLADTFSIATSALGGCGVNQTWQDVKASRSEGTSYQNTTGRPICWVHQSSSSGGGRTIQVSSDNSTWVTIAGLPAAGGFFCTIVPPNWYYRLTSGTGGTQVWAELR